MSVKFYKLKNSDNVIKLCTGNINTISNFSELIELTPNTFDTSKEKHVPVIEINNNKLTVCVGSIIHPMDDIHYISFIYLEKQNGGEIKYLKPHEEPKAEFYITDNNKPVAVYEYCTLHGLWKIDVI